MHKQWNWGILGAGNIARKFVSDLRLLPDARIGAVASRSGERAEAFAREQGIDKWHGSYEALAADPSIDIIYIASRHTGHYPDALLCLNHDKCVLCEKPVAMNRLQFERMVALANDKNCFFMEALWTRFAPSFIACKEMVIRGDIGDIRLIESDFCLNSPPGPASRLYNPNLGGGSLLDIGIYPVFCALEFGSAITDVKAMATLKDGIDTTCSIQTTHERGEQSVLFSSILTSGRNESIIHGSKGYVRLNRWWHTPTSIDLVLDGNEPERLTFENRGNGYQYEAAEVMRCLETDKLESDLWSWKHSRKLITMLDRIRELTGIRYPAEVEAI